MLMPHFSGVPSGTVYGYTGAGIIPSERRDGLITVSRHDLEQLGLLDPAGFSR